MFRYPHDNLRFASGLRNAETPGVPWLVATPADRAKVSTFSFSPDGEKHAHHHAHGKMSCEVYSGISTGFMGRDPRCILMVSRLGVAARPSTRQRAAYRVVAVEKDRLGTMPTSMPWMSLPDSGFPRSDHLRRGLHCHARSRVSVNRSRSSYLSR